MNKVVTIVILLLLTAGVGSAAAPCPTGSTVFTSTGGGNASSAATWSGSPIGTGDGACLIVTGGTVVIDQDLGVSGMTGVVLYANGGNFATGTLPALHSCGGGSYSICIFLASTGTDPCGSGNAALPGVNATAHGFFIANGNLSLLGTVGVKPIYLNSANNTNFWYAAKTEATGTSNITITGANLNHLGLAAQCGGIYPEFAGISLYDTAGTTQVVDVENSSFTNYYAAVTQQSTTGSLISLTAKNNTGTGRTGPWMIFGGVNFVNVVDCENNTDSAPTVAGFVGNLVGIRTSLTWTGNAGAGTASASVGNVIINGVPATHTISGNLVYNDPAQAGATSPSANGFDLTTPAGAVTLTTNYGENVNQGVAERFTTTAQSLTATNHMFVTNHLSQQGQGVFFASGGLMTLNNDVCVFVDPTVTGQENCVFAYTTAPGTTTTSLVATQNTLVRLGGGNTAAVGMGFAEPSFGGMLNNLAEFNLVYGFSQNFSNSTNNSYQNSFAGVGVERNATWESGGGQAYFSIDSPVRWDNGVQTHPNAVYNDVDGSDPGFLDTSRNIAAYDLKKLAGPGTVADFVTRLGYRSGWGGVYALGATPVADLITWVRYGLTPGNSAVCPSGVTYGAMVCLAAATAIIPQ